MKLIVLLGLILLLTTSAAQLQILFASTSPNSISTSLSGSIRGGTSLYIKALGFSPMATENSIFVGNFPCVIPVDGVTDTFISCVTSDTMQNNDMTGLSITLISNSQKVSTAKPYLFSYLNSRTPSLQEIYPVAGYAGSNVYLGGVHDILNVGDGRDMGDVTKLQIGNDICSRFDVVQAPFAALTDFNYLKCTQSLVQEANKYMISERVVPGEAKHSKHLMRSSYLGEKFEYVVIPTVTSVSPTGGNNAGNILTITGTGFSYDKQSSSVSVDGTPCDITSSTKTLITCSLHPRNGESSMISSDSASQVKGYFGGSGLKYTRYDLTGASTAINAFRTTVNSPNNTLKVLETGYRADLKSANVYEKIAFGQSFQGYFTAPESGVYTFTGMADDLFAVYLSTTIGSAEPAATPLIYSNDYQQAYPYLSDTATAEASVTLVGGSSYYFECYHINTLGDSYLRIDVSSPNNDPTLNFQTHAVHKLNISQTVGPQVITFTQSGATLGSITLSVTRIDPATLLSTYNATATFPFNANAGAVLAAVKKFDTYSSFMPSVTLTMYDSGNMSTTNAALAATYEWTISLYLMRSASQSAEGFKISYSSNFDGVFTYAITTPHAHLLGGTFGLSIGGVALGLYSSTTKNYSNTALPYSLSSWNLQSALRSISGYEEVEVISTSPISSSYSTLYIIYYYGVNSVVPPLIPNTASLTGGAVGVPPTVVFTERRPYSPSLLFDPIDYRFFQMASPTPTVSVKVNDIASACQGACSYRFALLTEVTSLTRSGSQLNLGLSDPTNIGFSLASVTVTLSGNPCTVISGGSISSFSCSIKLNTDGSPMIEGGTPSFSVFVSNVGYASLATGVSPLMFPLSVAMITPSSGGSNGGYLAKITGSGFSLSSVSVSLCSTTVAIVAQSNIELSFIVPPCPTLGDSAVTIVSGTLADLSLKFTFVDASLTAPVINSISPSSWNPAIKGVIEIFGDMFGSTAGDVTVSLMSSAKTYQLKVLRLNSTYIKAGIPGGLPGVYTLSVLTKSLGGAVANPVGANVFTYAVSIDSVSPTEGSQYGGTLLTIHGVNIAPLVIQNTIYVGPDLNQFCKIETLTESRVTCRTPPMSQLYKIGDVETVFASTNLIIDSTCTGACSFTYLDPSRGPQLTAISAATGFVNASVTLTGTNLASNSNCVVTLTSSSTSVVTLAQVTICSNTSISFLVPSLTSDYYTVKVRDDPIGESNPLNFYVSFYIGTASATSSSTAGTILTFTGTGYPATLPNVLFNFNLQTGGTPVNLNVVSIDLTHISITIPAGVNGQVFTLSGNGPSSANTFSKTISLTTASTPMITISSATNVASGPCNVQLNRTTLMTTFLPTSIALVSTVNPNDMVQVSSWTYSGSLISFGVTLNSGAYSVSAFSSTYGYALVSNILTVNSSTNILVSSIDTSFNGGSITVKGGYISPSSHILVNGLQGNLLSISSTQATYAVPALVTPYTQINVNRVEPSVLPISQYARFSDQAGSTVVDNIFNNLRRNSFNSIYSSPNSVCFIGVDVGAGLKATINKIRFFPNVLWAVASNYLPGATFQGSNDNITWTTLATVDQTVHSGWNTLLVSNTNSFEFIRFLHNNKSMCNLAAFQLTGVVFSNVPVTSLTSFASDLVLNDGFNSITFPRMINYGLAYTPVVNTVSSFYGNVLGGYPLTLTGTNLAAATPTVVIDGIPCVVTAATSNQIVCTVGPRLQLPASNSFVVTVGNSVAIVRQQFMYALRWSDQATWGTDLPPVDGDLISVPVGMTLLVDQSTPAVAGIICDGGNLIFSDEVDMTVTAGFITLLGGKFVAGTEAHPYQHKLTFVMTGDYYGPQQPMYGNKGIACMECQFSMYGQPRTNTWTSITATIPQGATSFSVQDPIDWKVGEVIVVASTDFDHTQAERFTITAVSGQTITVDRPFANQHFGGVEQYSATESLNVRAEVGLLTRNIKMMGDDSSAINQYGSHLMMTGLAANGLVGQIAYTEFTACGQPAIPGRYCIHFHMNGDVPDSFVRGNAVHDSFARVVTIHGVHFLTVERNVGYLVKGHNFFVEDGIETHNVIKYNLAIGSLSVSNMLQTDISVASFWVTNPTNDLIYNHAAGGDFYGFWYEIKSNPDGPSATIDVCPIGNPLGLSSNNVAHSYVRFGLRIFKMYARQNPCLPVRNDNDAVDFWQSNPSIQSIFSNYMIYKTGEDNVLAEQVGNVIFLNFTVAQGGRAGFEFYKANFTKEPTVILNSTIIGTCKTYFTSNSSHLYGSGVISPQTGLIQLTNVHFYNFRATQTILTTCSNCLNVLLQTNTGQHILTSGLTFTQVAGKYLQMVGFKHEIIYDLDGSFAAQIDPQPRTSATIMGQWPHLLENSHCVSAAFPSLWDNGIVCDQTVKPIRVLFFALDPKNNFVNIAMKAKTISDYSVSVALKEKIFSQSFSVLNNIEPMSGEMTQTFSMPFLCGQIYQIWWEAGIDFTYMNVYPSQFITANDPGIGFKFNYTSNRELYEINTKRGSVASPLVSESFLPPSPSNCTNGQYFHNNSDSSHIFSLCVSGKGKSLYEMISVKGILCRYLCPTADTNVVKETFVRVWSNTTQWPKGVLPADGDNITINGNWTLRLDMSTASLGNVIIDGDIVVSDGANYNFTAASIFIRQGSLTVGSAATPFQSKFTITLTGMKSDVGVTISPNLAGSKLFVNTGVLNLHGVVPGAAITKLSATAFSGSTSLKVLSTNGWAIGDKIVLSPSFSGIQEAETVTITSLTGTTVAFTPALNFTHYGAPAVTVTNNYGTLDTRTSVGHLTRNIQILAGPDTGYGFSIYNYGFNDGTGLKLGILSFSGVQLIGGGQFGTENGALVFMNSISANLSTVTGCSFVNSFSYCISTLNSKNIKITGNVFSVADKMHILLTSTTLITVSGNLMISVANARGSIAACLAMYSTGANVTITLNFCHGSTMHGIILPFVTCAEISTHTMMNNTVGSSLIGFAFNNPGIGSCIGFSFIAAFACTIGQIASSPPKVQTQTFSNFMLADNGRGATLRFGGDGTNQWANLQNSYIAAISRPTCAECYIAGAIDCQNNFGIRMLANTINGENLPKTAGIGFDVICRQATFDSKAFLTNVTFDNFRITYTGSAAGCSANHIFRPHSLAHDIVGVHHIQTSTCNNCETGAFAQCDAPDERQIGWQNGCGSMVCTGKRNYLIQDHDGSLFGRPGSIVPSNPVIGDNTANCTFYPDMNGYMCFRQDLAVLQFESIAADFNTRIMWPVNVTFDGSGYTNILNGWREWDWIGNEPQNHRLGRFVSIIQLSQIYNISFSAMPPLDMHFQIQKRSVTGISSDWIIVKIMYPLPNSIRVQNMGMTITPNALLGLNLTAPLNTSNCGENKYFYLNSTIHFVVTGDQNCLVRITLVESVQLTLHFDIDSTAFFTNNGQSLLVARLCALLKINDTSRVKIVGVYSGSTIVNASIETSPNSTNSSGPTSAQVSQTLSNASGVNSNVGGSPLGNVLAFSYVVTPLYSSPASSQDSSITMGAIIGIVLGSVTILVLIFMGVVHLIRKRAQILESPEIYDAPEINEKNIFQESGEVQLSGVKIQGMRIEVTNS